MSTRVRNLLVIAAAIAVDLLFWGGESRLAVGGGYLPYWVPVTSIVAVHSSLWWRRTHPVPVLLTQTAFALVSLGVPLWQPTAGLLIATFAVAANLPLPQARVGWLAAVPLANHSLVLTVAGDIDAVGLLQAFCLNLAAGAAAWFAGRRLHRRAEQVRAWQADQQRLRDEDARRERLALARELHDGVANTITAVLVQAAAARASGPTLAEGRSPQPALQGIEATARRAMEEIQQLLRLMPREADAADGPQLADLPALLALAGEAGLRLDFTETGVRRELLPAAQTAVYRAVQEGITNTLKYAPSGTRCSVTLAWTAAELSVAVVDEPPRASGPAPELPATGGRGLAGLQDRLRGLGGALESGSVRDGFRLAARVPVGVR